MNFGFDIGKVEATWIKRDIMFAHWAAFSYVQLHCQRVVLVYISSIRLREACFIKTQAIKKCIHFLYNLHLASSELVLPKTIYIYIYIQVNSTVDHLLQEKSQRIRIFQDSTFLSNTFKWCELLMAMIEDWSAGTIIQDILDFVKFLRSF